MVAQGRIRRFEPVLNGEEHNGRTGVPDLRISDASTDHPAGPGPDNAYGYCGYVFSSENALYCVRFRWYDPVTGRWLQRDPIKAPEGINLYNYRHVIRALDPNGLSPIMGPDANLTDQTEEALHWQERGNQAVKCKQSMPQPKTPPLEKTCGLQVLIYSGYWCIEKEAYEGAIGKSGEWLCKNSPVRGGVVSVGKSFGGSKGKIGGEVGVGWTIDDGVNGIATVGVGRSKRAQDPRGRRQFISNGTGLGASYECSEEDACAFSGGVEKSGTQRGKKYFGGGSIGANTSMECELGLDFKIARAALILDLKRLPHLFGFSDDEEKDNKVVAPATVKNSTPPTDRCCNTRPEAASKSTAK